MRVLIVSECVRGARPRTRRILDAFLERDGDRTWRGRLTEQGLDALRCELTAVASRNTSVAASVVLDHDRHDLQ
jgi:CRISPR-associated endonuclease/helicase Cas3